MKKLLPFLFFLVALFHNAMAADMAQDLAEHPLDPVMEQRLVNLAQKLRCLVCQNESLASSHADLAEDLRREVRDQMSKGKNDQEIVDYLVARYGDFVLYEPPVKRYTLLLWFGPFALLLVGVGVLMYQLRKRRKLVQDADAELSPEAQQRAASLLKEEDNK
jgi:cytochrome c-type biogenesis protein CcmH